jgi:hypothetical protein
MLTLCGCACIGVAMVRTAVVASGAARRAVPVNGRRERTLEDDGAAQTRIFVALVTLATAAVPAGTLAQSGSSNVAMWMLI